jgi:PKHD-type hydroxylase
MHYTQGAIGFSRKLTSVILLTDPSEYEGGALSLLIYPELIDIPKTRGTMVVFPSWLLHQVSPVENGIRQTLNVGFYGPPFR